MDKDEARAIIRRKDAQASMIRVIRMWADAEDDKRLSAETLGQRIAFLAAEATEAEP